MTPSTCSCPGFMFSAIKLTGPKQIFNTNENIGRWDIFWQLLRPTRHTIRPLEECSLPDAMIYADGVGANAHTFPSSAYTFWLLINCHSSPLGLQPSINFIKYCLSRSLYALLLKARIVIYCLYVCLLWLSSTPPESPFSGCLWRA